MIIKEYGKWAVYCDGCNEMLCACDSFEEAREAIHNAEWYTTKIGGTWINCCPTCKESL